MIRFMILNGYVFVMMYLQVTGKLNQYINVHYQYLAKLSLGLAALLAVVQLIHWAKAPEPTHEQADTPSVPSKKSRQVMTPRQLKSKLGRGIIYLLFSLPIIVTFLFPTVSLDATIVEAKGFQFPLSKESVGDPEMQTQYLKPDTSIYFNEDDYQDQMDALQKKYGAMDTLEITDENYLEVMEIIYNYPSQFIGKKVHYTGFVYQAPDEQAAKVFLFRFGIIHCVADSGVFGLLTELPAGTTVKNNDWLTIDGTIENQYYAPFKRNLPAVKAAQAAAVPPPKNQYVYRSF